MNLYGRLICRQRWLLIVLPALALAHAEQPVPNCVAPMRPPNKDDSETWNRFVDEVDVYRACMSEFIERNHAAADAHRAAANAATEQWNAFVRSSLNVPEDFPWPPEGR